ncbi:PrsW family glutamic-type intramembrane protease [Arthrobacter sp. ISL-85]|uniref:PrsW family glutamic-type intramembrane protease n=1 Tax=Arthrobacter sp. ISL-85 TaxID=2819115 RepID=UPI0020361677|nr:PrsW family glutamic-type intramembrane protease [Arthrobacter sp. ISL-85]
MDSVLRSHRHGWWWKTLLGGFALWIATIAVTGATGNSNLIPTLILLGSFLVPFTVVLFTVERVTGTLAPIQLILAFFFGGIFGVLGASLLESDLHASTWIYFRVGFIEEFVKAVIFVLIGRSVAPKTARQGALLGACVGAGFAAFESAGYAFNAAVTTNGIDVASLLQTEALRSVLTPVGHVLWTALLAAAVFAAADPVTSRYRYTRAVLTAFIGVAILHGLWDSMGGIAALLAFIVTGNAIPALEYGFLRPGTGAEVASLSSAFYVIGLITVSVLGLIALRRTLRRHRPLEDSSFPR